jgi:hypothetical protein
MSEVNKDLEAGARGTMDDGEYTFDDEHAVTPEKLNDDQTWKWDDDPNNPYNWPSRQKVQQTVMISAAAFTTLASSPLSV